MYFLRLDLSDLTLHFEVWTHHHIQCFQTYLFFLTKWIVTHPDCHKNPTFQKHFGILILKENQLKQGTSPLPSKLNSSDTSSSTVVCKEPVEVETVFSFEPWGFMPEYSNNGQFEHIDSVWKFFASKRNMEIAWNQNISFLMWSEDGRNDLASGLSSCQDCTLNVVRISLEAELCKHWRCNLRTSKEDFFCWVDTGVLKSRGWDYSNMRLARQTAPKVNPTSNC